MQRTDPNPYIQIQVDYEPLKTHILIQTCQSKQQYESSFKINENVIQKITWQYLQMYFLEYIRYVKQICFIALENAQSIASRQCMLCLLYCFPIAPRMIELTGVVSCVPCTAPIHTSFCCCCWEMNPAELQIEYQIKWRRGTHKWTVGNSSGTVYNEEKIRTTEKTTPQVWYSGVINWWTVVNEIDWFGGRRWLESYLATELTQMSMMSFGRQN